MSDFSGVGKLGNTGALGQDAQNFQGHAGERGFGGPDPGPQGRNRNRFSTAWERIQRVFRDEGVLTRPNAASGVPDQDTIQAVRDRVPALEEATDEEIANDPQAVQDALDAEEREREAAAQERADTRGETFTAPSGEYSENAEKAQNYLNRVGLDVEVDGLHGPETQQAIRTWQEAHDMEPTGQLTNRQYTQLVTDGLHGGSTEFRNRMGLNDEPETSLLD